MKIKESEYPIVQGYNATCPYCGEVLDIIGRCTGCGKQFSLEAEDKKMEELFVRWTKKTSEECGIPWVYLVSPEISEKYSKDLS